MSKKQRWKPCPFCGGEEIQIGQDFYQGMRVLDYLVFCTDCHTHGPPRDTTYQATRAWNRRIK